MSERLEDLSVAEAGRRLRAGTLTSEALTRHLLQRIEDLDPKLNAFITLTKERALSDAQRADAEFGAGKDRGPLHGIPYGLKDIYDTAGIRSTCHSKLRVDVVPEADGFAAQRLREGGGVLLGKLATHEFAIGGPSFDLPFPPARNPWNRDHFTGGSSSGSAAAIGARMMRIAMGSDTTSSIRGPAAFCGAVGLKPTYGRVSRRGVFPLSYTFDHCGPLTRGVEDAAIALQAIAGHDAGDPASVDVPVGDYLRDLEKGVAGLRIGVPRHFYAQAAAASPKVVAGIERSVALLREAGATVEEITLPDYALFAMCCRVIVSSEAFAIHEADLKARPLDFGAIALQRLVLGATFSATDLVQAFRLRRELTAQVLDVFGRYDAILTACVLTPAPRLDEFSPEKPDAVTQTLPFTVTGLPAISVPTGLSAKGMPLSVQIAGRPFDEATVLRIGRAVEKLTGWENQPFPEP